MDRPGNPVPNVQPEASTAFNKLRNFFEIKVVKISATTAIALGALGLAGCANGAEAAPQPTSITQTETGTPTPDVTETSTPNPTEVAPTAGEFVGEVLEQTKTIAEMDALSLKDFAKLSYGDRLAYAINETDNAYPTVDSSSDFVNTTPELIPGYFWQGAVDYAYNNASSDKRAKIAGAYMYYTTDESGNMSPDYTKWSNQAVSEGGEGLGNNYIFKATDHGELQHGKDRDGKPIDFINITYKAGTSSSVDSAQEVTAQAIRTQVKLLNGNSVIFYVPGIKVDGDVAPAEEYPY